MLRAGFDPVHTIISIQSVNKCLGVCLLCFSKVVMIQNFKRNWKRSFTSIWLVLPFTLVRHENRAFRKRSSNRRNLKTPAAASHADVLRGSSRLTIQWQLANQSARYIYKPYNKIVLNSNFHYLTIMFYFLANKYIGVLYYTGDYSDQGNLSKFSANWPLAC